MKKLPSCSNDQILSRDPQNVQNIRCIPISKFPDITLRYPFRPKHATYCSQGNANIAGSHSHDNILYAIDFLTPPEQEAGEILAAHDGIAYVYNKCAFRENKYAYFNLDNCGHGYGNNIRILHHDGYMTIYAHLSHITVKNRAFVRTGDKIGVEGISGNAGKRHLHFGLHLLKNMDSTKSDSSYLGQSIPFNMKLMINGKERLLTSNKIPCNNNLEKPLLEGPE